MTVHPINFALCDDGIPPKVWFAKITHEFKNGHHVFKSDSIPGLFIADKDAKKAFSQIVPAILGLVFASTGQKVQAFFGEDFKEFAKQHCEESPSIKDTMIVIQKAA